jgi:hypothetical protein
VGDVGCTISVGIAVDGSEGTGSGIEEHALPTLDVCTATGHVQKEQQQ